MRTDDNLRGRTVIAADGRAIGELVALAIDETTWHVASIRVELHKDIADEVGARRRVFQRGTIEIPVRAIQSVGDAVVLSVSVDSLRTETGAATEPPHPSPVH